MVGLKCRVGSGSQRCGLNAGHTGAHEPEGMDGPAWLRLRDVQRLHCRPGDRLVLETEQPWTLAQVDEARKYLQAAFRHQDVEIIMLPPRSRLIVVTPGQDEEGGPADG